MHRRALGDPQMGGRNGVSLGGKHLRQRVPAALTHGNDNLAAARLVLGQPPIDPVDDKVLQQNVAAKVGAVDLRCPPVTADRNAFVAEAIASRSLCARTKAVLYCTSRSRQKASMRFTSLQNTAIAIR
jgi:hypothetical protein